MNFVTQHPDPKILLITPLRKGDLISPETLRTIQNNKVPFHWISYEGEGNPAKNTQDAWDFYRTEYTTPSYLMKVDNDIECSKGMLDNMFQVLESRKDCSFAYCSFEFTGHIKMRFDVRSWNIQLLKKQNYISFNSLIRVKDLEKIGGFITDDKYFRLLDWCLWLKFASMGYKGAPDVRSFFKALSTPHGVSSRSYEDYVEKYQRVIQDFVTGRPW